MAPITRSMCVRAKRPTKSSSSSVRKSTKKQSGVVATRTSSKHKKHTDDKASSSSSCSKDDEEEEIFPADLLPEWVLVHIFSFLSVKEKCRLTRVSKRWRFLIKDPRLWRLVTDSPDDSGDLLKFMRAYLGKSLWCFRPNTMTTAGLRLLESRCPNLTYLLVAFSDKTLHHFAHLDIDYLPTIENVIIKGTKTKSGVVGDKRRLVFYLVSVRDSTNVNLPVDGFDELSLISRRPNPDQQDVNYQLALHHIL
ncbi:uncharacterized protein [Amphiura filiformis]|uniref:uncharacterized protein isoform X2 n=1 Tax=Amphiura filiformis TaxID=82378 RepID=UPI003B21D238